MPLTGVDASDTNFDQDLELVGVQTNVTTREGVPPDGGYGWVVTGCVFLINANTWGVNSVSKRRPDEKLLQDADGSYTMQAWGVFLARYLSDSYFPNATQLEYALIGGLSISQALLVTPLAAIMSDKFGTRPTLVVGTLLVSVAMLTSSFANHIWVLFLTQGACFGYGMGFLYITTSPVIPQWFAKRRSLAMGIASSGAGFGGLAYNLGAGAGIESLGPKWMYLVLAISTLVANLSCSILIKDRNRAVQPQSQAFSLRKFGHVSVLLVIIWGFVTELGYIVLLYSLPNYAISIGLSAQQGSVVGAVLNLGLAVGRPAIGHLSDRLGRINVATAMTG